MLSRSSNSMNWNSEYQRLRQTRRFLTAETDPKCGGVTYIMGLIPAESNIVPFTWPDSAVVKPSPPLVRYGGTARRDLHPRRRSSSAHYLRCNRRPIARTRVSRESLGVKSQPRRSNRRSRRLVPRGFNVDRKLDLRFLIISPMYSLPRSVHFSLILLEGVEDH
jgi:hypothetical protein